MPDIIVIGASASGLPAIRTVITNAPPDSHLLVDGYIRLSNGPREHHFRPAIDPLFRTAAGRFRDRVIGVILSGNLADGSHGLMLIKENGGIAIVQDPGEAVVSGMPECAPAGRRRPCASRARNRSDVNGSCHERARRIASNGTETGEADALRRPGRSRRSQP